MKKQPPVGTEIKVEELRVLFAWIADKLVEKYGGSIEIIRDFYRLPGSSEWFFDYEGDSPKEVFGSFVDEIDLMKKSILAGEDDLPDVVMERVGYLLLYFAYQAEKSRQ